MSCNWATDDPIVDSVLDRIMAAKTIGQAPVPLSITGKLVVLGISAAVTAFAFLLAISLPGLPR